MCKCLYCYQPLSPGEKDFHSRCSRRFFGLKTPPQMDYSLENLDDLASQVIANQTTLTGVQPKLSLYLQDKDGLQRFTIVGLWGNYILKPQSGHFPMLPEVEDLTMHLAELCKIQVVPHTLIRMADGSLSYLTRRIDRTEQGEKIDMEDMCQLTNRQTEHKYNCSYEFVGETIRRYSVVPKMDLVTFLDVLLFCFLTGNNDMHLKNFSLYEPLPGEVRLTPAYDLLNVMLVYQRDKQDFALKLNGKREAITREDFVAFAQALCVDAHVLDNLILKYSKLLPKVEEMIANSFLSTSMQEQYTQFFRARLQKLL